MTTASNTLARLRWLLITMLAMMAMLMSAQPARAGSGYLTTLNMLYNTAGTALDNCGLCHNRFVDPVSGADPGGLNPFGAEFKGNFAAVSGLRSDADTTSNGGELMAGFFPGWDCSNYTSAGGNLPADFIDRLDPNNIGCLANLPPVANPQGSYSGTKNVRVDFDGSGSNDPDGTVVQYDWDFGDGVKAVNVGPIPSHTYTAAGNYVLSLTVTDDAGATATATTMAFIVAVRQSPIADPGGPYDATEGVALTLDGGGSFDPDGGPILSYYWDFGDGNAATGAAPSHRYVSPGVYTVTLVVTDDEGFWSDAATTTAAIAALQPNTPPVADPKGPYTGTTGQPVSFDGSASSDADGTIVAYEWDFGDGSTGSGASPSHSYQAAGTYAVSLGVTDDAGLTSTASTTMVVNDALRLSSCEGISVKAVWKHSNRRHAYKHKHMYKSKYWKRHRKGFDEDDDDDHKHSRDRFKYGKLIVIGHGQPDSRFFLSHADDPEQIFAKRRGRTGSFFFRVNAKRLNPVPCRVQVDQPDLGLCGQADVINAPADCGIRGPDHHDDDDDHHHSKKDDD